MFNVNNKTDKTKNAKGFYIALGISALMIGSACYFSYKEGDNKYTEIASLSESSQQAVDRKETNIPKVTTSTSRNIYAVTSTTTTHTTTATSTTKESVTIPNAVVPSAEEYSPEISTSESTSEKLHQPLKNTLNILNEFSGKELVKNVTTGSWQTHNGTDYMADIGDDVFAVADGTITEVKDDALWGTTVVIQHENGDISRYCNLAKDLSVQQGSTVSEGDVLGSVGDTADIESALGSHLHIEIIKGGEYVNPVDFIESGIID